MHIKLKMNSVIPNGNEPAKVIVTEIEGDIDATKSEFRKLGLMLFTAAGAKPRQFSAKECASWAHGVWEEFREIVKEPPAIFNAKKPFVKQQFEGETE